MAHRWTHSERLYFTRAGAVSAGSALVSIGAFTYVLVRSSPCADKPADVVAGLIMAWVAMLTALVAGFGRLISEVGAVMLVGGNVQGATRVLTTSIVLETRQGDFDRALALGVILLVIALVINTAVLILQRRDLRHALPTA